MNKNDDARLLLLLKNDAQAGLAALLSEYGGLLNAIVSRVLWQSPQDAEECISDIIVAVWKNADKLYARRLPIKGWLCVTARNTAVNRYYKLLRTKTVELNEELASDMTLEPRSSEAEELIEQLVAAFSQPDREIFVRRYYLLQSSKEIGAALGMSENTVNARLSRGRTKLKAQFLSAQQEGFTHA